MAAPNSRSRGKAAVGNRFSGRIETSRGNVLRATPVYDLYWRFSSERQRIFMDRVQGKQPPWTNDPVLAQYRFTNPYRASDRVSQYLIRNVLYHGSQLPSEIFFRALLFRLFNRIPTWERLQSRLGEISWDSFEYQGYARVLDAMMSSGERVYSAAYIMPSPRLGDRRKHRNHLKLLRLMMRNGVPDMIADAGSLKEVYGIIRSYASMGPFLSFQLTIDLNYSTLLDFREADFVVAGPGARSGIHKCFSDLGGATPEDVIEAMAEHAADEFERLGLKFRNLWGRELQLVDLQNLFCEVDKYSRVVMPSHNGGSTRTRIKQRYVPNSSPLPQWYPPKWGLEVPTAISPRRVAERS